MRTWVTLGVVIALQGGAAVPTVRAQAASTSWTVTASPTRTAFGRWGRFNALALASRGTRARAAGPGVEGSLVVVIPGGAMSATAGCPPGVPQCVSELSTPGLLVAGLVGLSQGVAGDWGRAALAVGGIHGVGASGGRATAAVVEGGFDATWFPRSGTQAIQLSLRGMVLARDLMGMRALVVPGIGFTF